MFREDKNRSFSVIKKLGFRTSMQNIDLLLSSYLKTYFKVMKQPLAQRFERIVKENLSKRKQMISVLLESPLDSEMFYRKGMGVKSILKSTGRLTDFKGIYGFIENGKVVYIDESSYVIRRILRHYKGNSKYQRKLAHIMTSLHSRNQSLYLVTDAIEAMKKMKLIFMDVPDDLERQLTTLYFQCHFECIYNRFD